MLCGETTGGLNGLGVDADRHAGADCGDGSISAGVGASGGGVGGVWPVPSACCRFVSPLEGSRSSVSSHSSGPSHLLTLHAVTVSAARHLRLLCCNDNTVVKKGRRGWGLLRTIFRLFRCDFRPLVFFISCESRRSSWCTTSSQCSIQSLGRPFLRPPPRSDDEGDEQRRSAGLADGLDNDAKQQEVRTEETSGGRRGKKGGGKTAGGPTKHRAEFSRPTPSGGKLSMR